MDLGTIGILFSYLVILAMSATVVTLVLVYARRVRSTDGVSELDDRSNEPLEFKRRGEVERRSGRPAVIGRGIRRRAIPLGHEDFEPQPVVGVAASQIQQAGHMGVLARTVRWLRVKRIPSVWRRQADFEQKEQLSDNIPVENPESGSAVRDRPAVDGVIHDDPQAQVVAVEPESVNRGHDETSPDDEGKGEANDSEGPAETVLLTKEGETKMDDRVESKLDQAGLESRPLDVDPVDAEDHQAKIAASAETADVSETQGTATPTPKIVQASAEPPEAPAESVEADLEVQQKHEQGIGDISELFAKTTSKKAESNILAEQMNEVDASELLRRGRELLNSLKRSDG